jgi:trk system potassium uptake protein TrkH
VATGGFSTRNASIGAFDSAFIDGVVTLFMFLAGTNFALHYLLLRRHVRHYSRDEEFRFYVRVTVVAIVILAFILILRMGETPLRALRLASFQAVSIITTTGFGTADYVLWGYLAQLLLFLLMFFGGSAGSTGGGMKHMRVLLLGKNATREMRRLLHRKGVFNVKLSGRRVEDDIMLNILGFFVLYVLSFVVTTLVVAGMGVDVVTSMGAAAATLGNIGPGLGEVGPTSTYAALPSAGKILLSFCMLLGRLELYTVLVLLTPMFWRRT